MLYIILGHHMLQCMKPICANIECSSGTGQLAEGLDGEMEEM